MTKHVPLTRQQIAMLVAQDIPDGSVVNLGIGIPTLVGDYIPEGYEIILHSENGILGMGPAASGDNIDHDLVNASRTPVTLLDGASLSEHTVSFAVMRGGHLDYSVLGGFQVAPNGDLANWLTDAPDAIPAIGGAMDLAVGARKVLVTMTHNARDGTPKLVSACSYPLTGVGVVDTVYTDLAIIDVTPDGFVVRAMLENMDEAQLREKTAAPLLFSEQLKTIKIDQKGVPTLISQINEATA